LIADHLEVSLRTLEDHWLAIHRKLGSVNRCQAYFIYTTLRENPQGKVLA
jgi:DNA-binding CsgD family transcriptional regulator